MQQLDLFDLMEEDQHDPEIQYKLGLCYLHGYGTEKDPAQAELWLKRAAEQGHREAAALLGQTQPESADTAITEQTLPKWCLKAEEGDMDAQYLVACYFAGLDEKKYRADITHYLEEAAQQGHGQACLLLGRQLLEAGNESGAVAYLNRACECNISQAAELLSGCYYDGTGAPRDPEKAERLLQRAGQWGDAETYFRIALRYAVGRQIDASQAKAMAYLAKAQESGMENARERFEAQLEAYRQAEQARLERLRRQEEERVRMAEQARLEAERLEKEAAQRALEEQRARKLWEQTHILPMKQALQTGRQTLALAKLRNRLLVFPLGAGAICGAFVFWLAMLLDAPQTQAMLLGLGFVIAVTAAFTAFRKKIKPLDIRSLERQLAETQAKLEKWEKEGPQ